MGEIALSVRDLRITYKTIQSFSLKRIFSKNALKTKKFEALKGVSFDLHEGEILGIIGENGSGKSTLLRALASIYAPDSGSVETYGRTVSLMAIGAGFKKNLSGRDNIVLSGLLLGFSRERIMEKMDEIIEFSELGARIDQKVQAYSSGMYSKLAFSITAVLEPDILLIDEILSVGDKRFKQKSYKKMRELIGGENRSVAIVSHNLATLQKLCTRVIWIADGEIKMNGKPDEVIEAYEAYTDHNTTTKS